MGLTAPCNSLMRCGMNDRSEANSSWVARVCARLTLAFCLMMFGFGASVERGLAGHVELSSALTLAVSGDTSAETIEVDTQKQNIKVSDQGCHACPAISEPTPHGVLTLLALGEQIAWASVPSTDGREPLIDLPPPRV